MGKSLEYGLEYPELTDAPDVPYWQSRLALGVENAFLAHFQTGSVVIEGNGTNTAQGTISFPTAFAAVPTVVLCVVELDYPKYAGVTSRTTEGASIHLASDDGGNFSGSYMIHWIATDF